ncbi:MAG: DUF3050 domain-containing protein [Burkholderiales bacterium]|nr:DUF3050 domain-containing protein [Burkholderiales bacterium]
MLNSPTLRELRQHLDNHPIYRTVDSLPRLRCFMEHHIYSVWDFMSLVKSMQGVIAPAGHPWLPGKDESLRRFINDLVLGEESDEWTRNGKTLYLSHFRLYQQAMLEVGADVKRANEFLHLVESLGIDAALAAKVAPSAARTFMRSTFDCLASGKPHKIMASLAVGREHIIPDMFSALLREMAIEESVAPAFHYYLHRHVQLDGDHHGPMSLRLLDTLCMNDAQRIAEAQAAAEAAIADRIAFWDGVMDAMLDTDCAKERVA